jgi:uncharacterized protein
VHGGVEGPDVDDIEALLTTTSVWAVVGASADPSRASHSVSRRLQQWGFRVIPVNPEHDELFGERCYPSLSAIPPEESVEVVDVFRRSSAAGAVVDEAVSIGAAGVWLQLGVIDEAAAARARSAGLRVVMDRCPVIEYPRYRQAS